MTDDPPFFVTWCREQNAFHTETLDEMLSNNLDAFFGRIHGASDWIVVGVAKSRKEAFEVAENLRAQRTEFIV